MKTTVLARARFAALLAAAVAALACGDAASLSAPQPLAPEAATLSASHGPRVPHGGRVRLSLLRRTKPLAADEVACRYIDPARSKDDKISLRKAGLTVTFPAGSLPAPTNVCLTAQAGELLTYSFEPHGLQFNHRIEVEQKLHGTSAYHVAALASSLTAGYLPEGVTEDVDDAGVGEFSETFNTKVFDDAHTPTKTSPTTAIFHTTHFSGYALASGRVDSVANSH
jgi:hypothetical protein